jgi:ribosomal protein S18 acetylase RimI-like enzyme
LTRIDPPVRIRPAERADRQELYDINAETGAAGGDARPLYRHVELLAEIWVGPYLEFEPELAFVAEDGDGPVGYVLGAADTSAFEAECERRWWPALRARYPEPPSGSADTPDAELIHRIHHPPLTPASVVAEFPAHLHIDIRERGQGRGVGRRLMTSLLDALARRRVAGVHLDVDVDNTRAIGFYEHLGFRLVDQPDDGGLTLGLRLLPRPPMGV